MDSYHFVIIICEAGSGVLLAVCRHRGEEVYCPEARSLATTSSSTWPYSCAVAVSLKRLGLTASWMQEILPVQPQLKPNKYSTKLPYSFKELSIQSVGHHLTTKKNFLILKFQQFLIIQ